jgi:hypothetical protein
MCSLLKSGVRSYTTWHARVLTIIDEEWVSYANNMTHNPEISRVDPVTRLPPWSCLLSIPILIDFHHDRINDNLERVVMHFYGFNKFLQRKCTTHYKVNTVIKQNPDEAVCTSACLCSEWKKDSLELHECWPPSTLARTSLLDVVITYSGMKCTIQKTVNDGENLNYLDLSLSGARKVTTLEDW